MNNQKKRRVGEDAAPEQPRGEPDNRQVQSQVIGPGRLPPLLEFPERWYWAECANAQLRILVTNPESCAQGMAMWRYCICLAVIHGELDRWTGYTAGVIQGHASNAHGSHRWRTRYLQGVVDFAAAWVPLAMNGLTSEPNSAEILQVETN